MAPAYALVISFVIVLILGAVLGEQGDAGNNKQPPSSTTSPASTTSPVKPTPTIFEPH
jgi:hypothetical protein